VRQITLDIQVTVHREKLRIK